MSFTLSAYGASVVSVPSIVRTGMSLMSMMQATLSWGAAFRLRPCRNRHAPFDVEVRADSPPRRSLETTTVDMKLELVPLPVADVDRSLAFYAERVGFHLDHDVRPGNGIRIIQLTPPGSACSIVLGSGMGNFGAEPGSVKNLHLVVADITAARAQLVERGVAVSPVDDMGGVKYAYFADPDANSWALQEIPARW